MSTRNAVPASLLSAFALTALFLLAAVANAEAGAPLKGVDVKLGKSPGGGAQARTTTDNQGHFTFSAVPAGSYALTLGSAEPVKITVSGAVGGSITKTFNQASQSTARAAAPMKIDLKSDGKTPLTGIVETTVVKSKSNISNN